MTNYYLINVKEIKEYIWKLDKLDPERVLCWLDLLNENIQKNLLQVIKHDKIMVELDHQKKEVSLLWDTLPTSNWEIVFDKEKNSKSIYNTFMFAFDYVDQIEWWDSMIKKIKSKHD